MSSFDYASHLDGCTNFSEIFDLVKKAVEKTLGLRRAGLMLYLADLPLQLGAYHGVGSNVIVVNGAALRVLQRELRGQREVNSYTFTVLLHEYLHSLGFLNEQLVRQTTQNVCLNTFGPNHPTTRNAYNPVRSFAHLFRNANPESPGEPQLVKDFDSVGRSYVV